MILLDYRIIYWLYRLVIFMYFNFIVLYLMYFISKYLTSNTRMHFLI
uniref:Uncharacterized protein n=1 Tax=Myoviridae sp. ctCo31 TaxID=2825053 RepID=A0A8S5UN02_9CAUD|nr:MAG TPA: hypothetical protein [Myoviridae sp. ctCo31]